MKIGIDLNNVLRDTLKKIEQVYERWFIEQPNEEDDFKYEIKSPVESLDLMSHLSFRDEEHLYDFLYKDFTMEIFGHAGSVEMTTMNDLNDFYLNLREKHDIIIVSDEIGKSKPATLFFISKFGCLIETIKFYSEQTKKDMWDSVDILLTANPELLLNRPSKKMVIKYETSFNNNIHTEHTITKMKELENKIKEIYEKRFG
jgi:hypothetical protein